METQGQRIKKIRQALDLSQEEFGKIFDISKQYISLLEKDQTQLNNDKLVKLLFDYNVNLNYVIGGVGSMFIPQKFEDVKTEILSEVNRMLQERGL